MNYIPSNCPLNGNSAGHLGLYKPDCTRDTILRKCTLYAWNALLVYLIYCCYHLYLFLLYPFKIKAKNNLLQIATWFIFFWIGITHPDYPRMGQAPHWPIFWKDFLHTPDTLNKWFWMLIHVILVLIVVNWMLFLFTVLCAPVRDCYIILSSS